MKIIDLLKSYRFFASCDGSSIFVYSSESLWLIAANTCDMTYFTGTSTKPEVVSIIDSLRQLRWSDTEKGPYVMSPFLSQGAPCSRSRPAALWAGPIAQPVGTENEHSGYGFPSSMNLTTCLQRFNVRTQAITHDRDELGMDLVLMFLIILHKRAHVHTGSDSHYAFPRAGENLPA